MENKMTLQVKKCGYPVLYMLLVVLSLLPVGSNYIMTGGRIGEWIIRVEDLALGLGEGILSLFPKAEVFLELGVEANGMNSNLWFIPAGILYKITGDIIGLYRISMILLQLGTLLALLLFFRSIFDRADSQWPIFFGSLLYMTCPYRIYTCYDLADMSGALVWMLLPLYGWALIGMKRPGKHYIRLLVGAVALSGIGYADAVFFIIITGVTLLLGILCRCWQWILTTVISCGMFLPGVLRMARYLFLGHYSEWNFQVNGIMDKGYHIGEFFTVYAWREGHPGMGAGLLLCLGIIIWFRFVLGIKGENRLYVCCTVSAMVCMLLALSSFPWDVLQRIGGFALRFIGLMGTPAIWAGVAYALLIIPATAVLKQARKQENQILSKVLPLLVVLVCVAGCIYQCNTLTYQRPPMMLP